MLLPIGTYWPQDVNGFLLNPCIREHLGAEALELAEATAEVYRTKLGSSLRSVYLRGSAVRGTAVSGLSDWDSFAVVDWDGSQAFRRWETPEWASKSAAELEARFTWASKVEFVVCDWADAQPQYNPRVRSLVKVESLLWEGEDLGSNIAPIKVGHPHLQRNLRWLTEDWQTLCQLSPEETTSEAIRTFIKVLIRSAFESIMDQEEKYAVDFYPCIQSFLSHHPEFETTLNQLVSFFTAPPHQIHQLIILAKPLVDHLSSKA